MELIEATAFFRREEVHVAEELIDVYLNHPDQKDYDVVVIEGARQVGKSTLASMLGDESTTFVTMDDDLTRGYSRDDPQGF